MWSHVDEHGSVYIFWRGVLIWKNWKYHEVVCDIHMPWIIREKP
jgi:hypothetical protein